MRLALALLLCSCAAVVTDPRVLQLRSGDQFCSAVAVAPHRVLTAEHCIDPVGLVELRQPSGAQLEAVVRTPWVGADIVTLKTTATLPAFEYATAAPQQGDLLQLIGYGCGGQQTHELRALQPALAAGEACHGDSGGAVLNASGELVGVFVGWDPAGQIRYVQITKQAD